MAEESLGRERLVVVFEAGEGVPEEGVECYRED